MSGMLSSDGFDLCTKFHHVYPGEIEISDLPGNLPLNKKLFQTLSFYYIFGADLLAFDGVVIMIK